ncbi:MAG: hypothetical protein AAB462_00030 [Patescibacteria group bacterium]
MTEQSEQSRPQETQLSPEQIFQAGSEFLQHFGVEADPFEQPQEFQAALEQLNPRFQGGRDLVRFELEADQTEWDEPTKDVIMRAAEGMRMLETETPLTDRFDVVIALGGARQSNLDRTRYAVKAIREKTATVDNLIVAGSSRVLSEAEQDNVENYAYGAEREYQLCSAAAATVRGENPDLTIGVFGSEGVGEKAGTPAIIEEVLTMFRDKGKLPYGARVGAVTTQIYQASTELDLARVAKQFGITETFTAGNPSDPNIVEARTPATYLSEVLRTLRAAANSVEAEKNGIEEKYVRSNVQQLLSEKHNLSQRQSEIDRELDEIDRLNPQLSQQREEEDGSLIVTLASGREWTAVDATGTHYSSPKDTIGSVPE